MDYITVSSVSFSPEFLLPYPALFPDNTLLPLGGPIEEANPNIGVIPRLLLLDGENFTNFHLPRETDGHVSVEINSGNGKNSLFVKTIGTIGITTDGRNSRGKIEGSGDEHCAVHSETSSTHPHSYETQASGARVLA